MSLFVPNINIPKAHETWFEGFSARYITEATREPLELKREHTAQVVDIAGRIVASLDLAPQVAKAALIAALYHDVGRFPQYARWQTFKDADSENHGHLGAVVLKKNPVLLEENPALRHLVLTAVLLHNRYALPAKLPEPFATVTRIVRDADKVDIMRIMASELLREQPSRIVALHVANQPEAFSPHIADMVLAGHMPNYSDLRFVNDFIILVCFWPFDLAYGEALRTVLQNGHLALLLEKLNKVQGLQPVCAHLEKTLEQLGRQHQLNTAG